MKLRNGMLKIMAAFLKRRGKKEEKTQFLWKKEKNWKKKKARTGFEPAIFGAIFVSSNPVTIEMTPPRPESSSTKLQEKDRL